MIKFENEICDYLSLPSIPLKAWGGTQAFHDGVAVVEMRDGTEAYAVATFDPEKDSSPKIKKTFSLEPFVRIKDVFVVPNYMDISDIDNADLDSESKKAAERLASEVKELEEDGVESDKMKEMKSLPEWVFPEVSNVEQAIAYIKAYNKRNKIRNTKISKNEETLKLRLLAIYNEINKKN